MNRSGDQLKAVDALGRTFDFTLAGMLAESGEGQIWRTSRPGELAKIYLSKDGLAQRTEKLKTMIEFPPQDPATPGISIAWPKMLLPKTANGSIGFLMPEITDAKRTVVLYIPKTRKIDAPGIDWFYLHTLALNTAKVCRAVHERGYVIGDLKAENWLVDRNMTAVVIDTDSFQIRHPKTHRLYRCPVGTPDYCAPEIFGKDFATFDRAVEHDHFAMAVLIYQFLFGRHPFSGGDYTGHGQPSTETSQRISKGQWLWKNPGDFRARPSDLQLDALHPPLAKLMRRAFDDGHLNPKARPSAREWEDALNTALSAIAWCDKEPMHVYSGHQTACPWCALKKSSNGFDVFAAKPGIKSRSFDAAIGRFREAEREKRYELALDMIKNNPRLAKQTELANLVAEVKKWEPYVKDLREFKDELLKPNDKRDDFALIGRLVNQPALVEKAKQSADLTAHIERLKALASAVQALEAAIQASSGTAGRYAVSREQAIYDVTVSHESALKSSPSVGRKHGQRTGEARLRVVAFDSLKKVLDAKNDEKLKSVLDEYGARLETITEYLPLKPDVEKRYKWAQTLTEFVQTVEKAKDKGLDDTALCSLWESVEGVDQSPLASKPASALSNLTPAQFYHKARKRRDAAYLVTSTIRDRQVRTKGQIVEEAERDIYNAFVTAENAAGSLAGLAGGSLQSRFNLAKQRLDIFGNLQRLCALSGNDADLGAFWQNVADKEKYELPAQIALRLKNAEAIFAQVSGFTTLLTAVSPDEAKIVEFAILNPAFEATPAARNTAVDNLTISERIELARKRVNALAAVRNVIADSDRKRMTTEVGEYQVMDAWEKCATLLTPWEGARKEIEGRVNLAYERINRTQELTDAVEKGDEAAALAAWGQDGVLENYEPAQAYRELVSNTQKANLVLEEIKQEIIRDSGDGNDIRELIRKNEWVLRTSIANKPEAALGGRSINESIRVIEDRKELLDAIRAYKSQETFENLKALATSAKPHVLLDHKTVKPYEALIREARASQQRFESLAAAIRSNDGRAVAPLWDNKFFRSLPPQDLEIAARLISDHAATAQAFAEVPIGGLKKISDTRTILRWDWIDPGVSHALVLVGDITVPENDATALQSFVLENPKLQDWPGQEITFKGRLLTVRVMPVAYVGTKTIIGAHHLILREGKRVFKYFFHQSLLGDLELNIQADRQISLPGLRVFSTTDGTELHRVAEQETNPDGRVVIPLRKGSFGGLMSNMARKLDIQLLDDKDKDWAELIQEKH